jgi:3alpha(or 20beta)-hydroxysteroid dehydrogenase
VAASLTADGNEVIGLDLDATGDVRAFDVRDPAAWAQLVAELNGRPVRGLVNCAGATWRARLGEVTAEAFAQVHAVNVTGPLLGIQALAPSWRSTGESGPVMQHPETAVSLVAVTR